jgi:hypothetical protein
MAWSMILLATEGHVEPSRREAMRHLIRAYGEARYEHGRAREAEVAATRADEIELERQQAEFQRRLRQREMLA